MSVATQIQDLRAAVQSSAAVDRKQEEMKDYYVSLTGDLLNCYIHYRATSKSAVQHYLEKTYLRRGEWRLPWCAIYTDLTTLSVNGIPVTIIEAKCGDLLSGDYDD